MEQAGQPSGLRIPERWCLLRAGLRAVPSPFGAFAHSPWRERPAARVRLQAPHVLPRPRPRRNDAVMSHGN